MSRFCVERRAQHLDDVEVPGLAEDGDHGRLGGHELVEVGVLVGAVGLVARGAEGRQLGVLQVIDRAAAKNSMSLGLEPGQPPSM